MAHRSSCRNGALLRDEIVESHSAGGGTPNRAADDKNRHYGEIKKPLTAERYFFAGGADETRTRDLQRDRLAC